MLADFQTKKGMEKVTQRVHLLVDVDEDLERALAAVA
jgi:hypothetical protein